MTDRQARENWTPPEPEPAPAPAPALVAAQLAQLLGEPVQAEADQ